MSAAPVSNLPRTVAGTLLATALDATLLALTLGGLAPLLSHPRALALLAVWGAGSVVLGLTRPVRTHDPAATTRPDVPVMLALFLIPLAVPPLSAWAERRGWGLLGGDPLGWLGVALAAAGLALRIAAMLRLGSRFSPVAAVQKTHAVESRWPYSWIRHPGYAGTLLAAVGACLAFRSAVALPLVLLLAAVYRFRVRDEEAALESHLGATWRDYRSRTGAFLPRF